LQDYAENDDSNKTSVLLQIMVQIAYVHELFKDKNIAHNDIKLDNILVDFNKQPYKWTVNDTEYNTNFGNVVFIDFSKEEKSTDDEAFLAVLNECRKKHANEDDNVDDIDNIFDYINSQTDIAGIPQALHWQKDTRAQTFCNYTIVSNVIKFTNQSLSHNNKEIDEYSYIKEVINGTSGSLVNLSQFDGSTIRIQIGRNLAAEGDAGAFSPSAAGSSTADLPAPIQSPTLSPSYRSGTVSPPRPHLSPASGSSSAASTPSLISPVLPKTAAPRKKSVPSQEFDTELLEYIIKNKTKIADVTKTFEALFNSFGK
jgi:serine/threonine protein kinase